MAGWEGVRRPVVIYDIQIDAGLKTPTLPAQRRNRQTPKKGDNSVLRPSTNFTRMCACVHVCMCVRVNSLAKKEVNLHIRHFEVGKSIKANDIKWDANHGINLSKLVGN